LQQKDSTSGIKPIGALEYNMSCIRKHGGSDMDEYNPHGDQTTHFINCVEGPNATNSTYNHKKMGTTFET
jgi:hypothetical protein